MINRPYYIDWLNRWKDSPVIKIITGMRRCGKSTIMKLFQEDLKQNGVKDSDILSINFESYEEDYPLEQRELYNYIVSHLGKSAKTYIFLDEVQVVKEFEKTINALVARGDVDVYLTGSNAFLLSSEFATLFTGRTVEIKAYPFSFKEYVTAIEQTFWSSDGIDYPHDFPFDFAPDKPTKQELFNRYLTYGGLPYAATLSNDLNIEEYISGVFSNIIIKDIAKRRPRMDLRAFESTASFLADNVGNISSIKKIATGLDDQNKHISQGAIGEYLESMIQSYLLFKVDRYDLKGKQFLKTLEKYYLGDLGLRYWLLGKRTGDVGRRIENIVYLELCRRFSQVKIGKQGDLEIDFVATNPDDTQYFQVSQTILDDRTLERELKPLQNVPDNYQKTLLTLDVIGTGDIEGIKHVNLLNWLLAK